MQKLTTSFIEPSKFPFFYGYLIVIVGTIGILASLPGQTVGIATFTDPVMQALNLTRDQFSLAYMVGTLLSSFLITRTGRFYDRHGALITSVLATLLLGITLLLCSVSDVMARWLSSLLGLSHWLVPFCVMAWLFFMLRFSGQGVLTMVSRNMIMKWFDRYQGRVNAICSVCVALGFSASPILIEMLIQKFGWSGAWQMMAMGMVAILLMVLLFYKDNPTQYGLVADGLRVDTQEPLKIQQANFSLASAIKTRAFWIYALLLSFYSFYVTGVTFHVVSIFSSAGYSRSDALSIFLPISIISIFASIGGNLLSEWIRLKFLLYAMIVGAVAATVGLIGLDDGWGVYCLIGGTGVMGGLFTVLMAITWPRFFGLRNLGAISGKAMSMLVLASALGPVLFSISKTLFHSYEYISWISLVYLFFVAAGAPKANPPVEPLG
ncbi:MAG: MFS transporter [Desulforhopalus sp.]